jgi:predicted RNA-binding protein associated with RNAse of E/G family
MRFRPGEIINRRYLRGQWCTWMQAMRVIADDEEALLLWHPAGSDFARIVDADGKTQHDVPVDQMRDPQLTLLTWETYDILVLMPAEAAHSVWWFYRDGAFAGWYVNLEEPYVRRPGAVDTNDQLLDIVVTPQRQWEWKDVDEFTERTGNPLYFDSATADAVRAEGERLIKLIEAGDFPFDGTYTDFRPDPDWPIPRLPSTLASVPASPE